MIENICAPALLYLGFSSTQIIIDMFKGLYNTAFFKFIVMIIMTLLLNILCSRGLNIVSWLIVFIPFILMTYITAVLMYVFGLSPSVNGDYEVEYPSSNETTQNKTIVINKGTADDDNNSEYDPDDFTSGTPEDINHYNE
jgi:predicted membrane protein